MISLIRDSPPNSCVAVMDQCCLLACLYCTFKGNRDEGYQSVDPTLYHKALYFAQKKIMIN